MTNLNAGKADLFAALLAACGLDLTPRRSGGKNSRQLSASLLVAISVDKDEVRRTVQFDMPGSCSTPEPATKADTRQAPTISSTAPAWPASPGRQGSLQP